MDVSSSSGPGGLLSFALVLARVAGAVTFIPLPGVQKGPEPARIVLALSLTIALAPVWPAAGIPESAGRLAVAILAEAAFGIGAGLFVSFVLESIAVAFQMIGLQAGYSYASTIDPLSNADSSVLVVLGQLMGGLLFLAFGLDQALIRALAFSLRAHPPGAPVPENAVTDALVLAGSGMLSTGLRLAFPVIALLLLIDCTLALLGRMHQQLQLITLAFPLKMAASFLILAAVAAVFAPVWRAFAEQTIATAARVL